MNTVKTKLKVKKLYSDVVTKTFINLILAKYPNIRFQDIPEKLSIEFHCICTIDRVEQLLALEIEEEDIIVHMQNFNYFYNNINL